MEKKKILFVLNSLTAGGAEKQTISLLNTLDTARFELSLVYLDAVDMLLPQVDKNRLAMICCLDRQKRFDLRVIEKIVRLIRDHEYDIVVCVGPYPLIYAFIGRWLSSVGFAVLQISHLTIPRTDLWTAVKNRLLYQNLMNRCEKIIFVCRAQMDYWIGHYSIRRDRSTFIYNGVDTNIFTDSRSDEEKQQLRRHFGFTPDDFVVGICAALRPEKKHTEFVDAVGLARNRIPHIKGLIIGDGALRDGIQRHIETSDLSSVIRITGFQNDVRPCVGICDCMVLTSHAVETFSISALESMAMAKPVVLTNLGGAGELVEHGVSGFIYEAGDIDRLVSHLTALAKNKAHIGMGEKARQRVEANFTKEKMVAAYEALLSQFFGR